MKKFNHWGYVESSIVKTLESLPHAFNSKYWNLSDTTYSHEVFLSLIKEFNLDRDVAIAIMDRVYDNEEAKESLLEIIDGVRKEVMGTYPKK